MVPGSIWMFQGDSRMTTVAQVIAGAYPSWPDIVQGYREGHRSLVEMIRAINDGVCQTLTTMVHTQAEAVEGAEIIDAESIASLPATRLYLAEPWRRLIASFRREPLLPRLNLIAKSHERVLADGQAAVFEIWNALGWTITEWPVRQWEVRVAAPKRLDQDLGS
jgi:hypothetical protein